MQDAWRAYLELAFGLTEASRRKAREVAREVLGKGGATAAQVQSFVDDLVSTSRTNREGLARLVRYEVDRALGAVGLATADEVADLTARLRELERRLSETGTDSGGGNGNAAGAGAGGAATPAPAVRPAAKKPMAKKAVAKKSTGSKTAATKTPATKTAATKTAAKPSTPTKQTAR